MGNFFTLSDHREDIIDALDDLIEELGSDCKLVYPPKMVPCDCAAGGNHWRTGGLAPARFGVCQLCNGTNMRASESASETIKMSTALDPRYFFRPVEGIDIRSSGKTYLQTKTYIWHYPKVKACDHMIYQPALIAYANWKFKLIDEPIDNAAIISERYFVCTWERVG